MGSRATPIADRRSDARRAIRGASIASALLFVTLCPAPVRAHADLDPLHDHRVLSLHLTDDGVVAQYVLAFSAATSEELRRGADANHDGLIAAEETTALAAGLVPLARGLALDLDGANIALARGAPHVEGAVGDVAGPREIAARWEQRLYPTTTGEHRFAVADGTKLARPGDLHVRISGEGQSRVLGVDHRVESRLSFLEAAFHRQDACQSATCALEIRFLGGGLAPKSPAPVAWGLLLGALGLVPLVVYGYRRRRSATGA